jgi:ABC-type multidrug transport system fused ATPase/permease subunit
MDEATSALDNITERAIMDAVANISQRLTIILIAHRLTTVRQCDTILLLERGRIVARGNYDALLASSEHFREIVERGEHDHYSNLCGA